MIHAANYYIMFTFAPSTLNEHTESCDPSSLARIICANNHVTCYMYHVTYVFLLNTVWQVGSETLSDDIIPKTEVSFNNSRSAAVQSGVLYVGGAPFANLSEVIALAEGKVEDPADNELYLEPGRLYYNSLEMCNFVHRCVVAETAPSIVIRKPSSNIILASFTGLPVQTKR